MLHPHPTTCGNFPIRTTRALVISERLLAVHVGLEIIPHDVAVRIGHAAGFNRSGRSGLCVKPIAALPRRDTLRADQAGSSRTRVGDAGFIVIRCHAVRCDTPPTRCRGPLTAGFARGRLTDQRRTRRTVSSPRGRVVARRSGRGTRELRRRIGSVGRRLSEARSWRLLG